ncbi:FeoA family protein [Oleispirillum naphthae]|uniref:FeoA family protein n=1 Tax=Oleispirillum naphthae TaxID=2838853 RepID=UPI0030825027
MTSVLRDMAVGDSGRVLGFLEGSSAYRRKLLALGLTKGAAFRVTRVAPLGDPVEIVVRGFSLSLRRAEADIILVEKEG